MPEYLDDQLRDLAAGVLIQAKNDIERYGSKSARRFLQTAGADLAECFGFDRQAWLAAVARIKRVKAPKKGRQPRLTPEQVEEIAGQLAEGGVSMWQLAIVYGVHRETIRYHLRKHGKIVEKERYNAA